MLDIDHLLDAGQMRRQAAAVGTALLLGPGSRRPGGVELGFDLGDGNAEIFHHQLELVVVELLRTRPEAMAREGRKDAAQSGDLGIGFSLGDRVALSLSLHALHLCRQLRGTRIGGDDHGAEHLGIIWKISRSEHDGQTESRARTRVEWGLAD